MLLPLPLFSALLSAERRASCTLRGLHALLDHLVERTRVVQVWERLIHGHRDMQEAAQGLPTLLHVVDQQPLGWDTVLDLLDMSLEDGDRSLLILERPAEGPLPDEGVDQCVSIAPGLARILPFAVAPVHSYSTLT